MKYLQELLPLRLDNVAVQRYCSFWKKRLLWENFSCALALVKTMQMLEACWVYLKRSLFTPVEIWWKNTKFRKKTTSSAHATHCCCLLKKSIYSILIPHNSSMTMVHLWPNLDFSLFRRLCHSGKACKRDKGMTLHFRGDPRGIKGFLIHVLMSAEPPATLFFFNETK